ncbi:MAG: dethiobiotin synthase [Chromatiaceae bacterium]
MKGVFVTGTDTDCGKTEICLALMIALQARGLCVLGMKPVASGCDHTPRGASSEDARRLRAQGSAEMPYELVNPYAFEPPVAPHIAAGQTGAEIEQAVIRNAAHALAAQCDFLVIEGVGGWRVPLGPALFVSDLPRALGLPVVLVCGLRLGCINHTLLTAESILATGNRLIGWVANQLDPDLIARQENLATLAALIDAPCLGVIPWLASPDSRRIAHELSVDPLLASGTSDDSERRSRRRGKPHKA